jgi:hypothetical protein
MTTGQGKPAHPFLFRGRIKMVSWQAFVISAALWALIVLAVYGVFS